MSQDSQIGLAGFTITFSSEYEKIIFKFLYIFYLIGNFIRLSYKFKTMLKREAYFCFEKDFLNMVQDFVGNLLSSL